MNRTIILAAIVIALSSFAPQTIAQAEVSGQVRDSVNRDPLSFCNISALNRQDSLVNGLPDLDNKMVLSCWLHIKTWRCNWLYRNLNLDRFISQAPDCSLLLTQPP